MSSLSGEFPREKVIANCFRRSCTAIILYYRNLPRKKTAYPDSTITGRLIICNWWGWFNACLQKQTKKIRIYKSAIIPTKGSLTLICIIKDILVWHFLGTADATCAAPTFSSEHKGTPCFRINIFICRKRIGVTQGKHGRGIHGWI